MKLEPLTTSVSHWCDHSHAELEALLRNHRAAAALCCALGHEGDITVSQKSISVCYPNTESLDITTMMIAAVSSICISCENHGWCYDINAGDRLLLSGLFEGRILTVWVARRCTAAKEPNI